MSKQSYFKQITFNIRTQFSSIWPIDRNLSGATTLGQSGPGSDGNEGVLCIPRTSPSDHLVSYPGHLLGRRLPLCREAVSVFYSHNQYIKVDHQFLSKKLYIWIYSYDKTTTSLKNVYRKRKRKIFHLMCLIKQSVIGGLFKKFLLSPRF